MIGTIIKNRVLKLGESIRKLTSLISISITILKIRFIQQRKFIYLDRRAGIGDIVCSFSAIHVLKTLHPNHLILFATEENCMSIVTLHPDIYKVFIHGKAAGKLATRLADFSYPIHTAIDGNRGHQYKHLIEDVTDSFPFLVPNTYFRIFPKQRDLQKVATYLTPHVAGKRLKIAICIGPTWPVKTWPVEMWINLIDKINAKYDCAIIQLGAGKVEIIGGALDLVDKLSLSEAAAVLSQCDLMVSHDSGLLHIARAVGTPVVGIFGPTLGRLIVDAEAEIVQADVDCKGCHHENPHLHWKTGCPNDTKCMKSIDADDVLAKVDRSIDALLKYDKRVLN